MEVIKKTRKINAARICFGISRIGYTPASAICDIIDNAVSAHAKNIHIKIIQKSTSTNLNKKNDVQEYLIIDDGCGMNKEKIENALDLGSSDTFYSEGTLSKFGLGLKSASFAQGSRLEIISGDGSGEINKEYVDLEEIEDEYYSVECDLNDLDRDLAQQYFENGNKGTIIRISKIHTNNHPSIKTTISELEEKLGVIYYYFLRKELHISINDIEIDAVDALFTEEAGDNKLDENIWDGKSVQWILKPVDIVLDSENEVSGKIEITMLPHPKVRKNEGISDADIRKKYHISASNYGFYVYRNGRLINWANRLDIIPQDQDYYAFRGRINIQSDADDAFNIDVSKSHIMLSEDAKSALDDYILDYKSKCKNAWQNAWQKYLSQTSESSNERSNSIAIDVDDYLDDPLNDDSDDQKEREIREAQINEEMRQKETYDTINRLKDEEGEEKTKEQITDEDIVTTMKGSPSISDLDCIFKVQSIQDNMIWEPYADAERKQCVRISKNHRFSKVIYENNSNNTALQILIELMLLIAAKAELNVRKKPYSFIKSEQIRELFYDYRYCISENLTKLCRKAEDTLPSD